MLHPEKTMIWIKQNQLVAGDCGTLDLDGF
jgi:hypothetical protein